MLSKKVSVIFCQYSHACLCPASQLKTLIRLLPFILGEVIPEEDDHWLCLLVLWDICTLVSVFQVNEGDAAQLSWSVQLFLEMYVDLYGESTITPKMHYLLHLPQDMLRYTIKTEVDFPKVAFPHHPL